MHIDDTKEPRKTPLDSHISADLDGAESAISTEEK